MLFEELENIEIEIQSDESFEVTYAILSFFTAQLSWSEVTGTMQVDFVSFWIKIAI